MGRTVIAILVLIVSLWAVRSYRQSERRELSQLNGESTEAVESASAEAKPSRGPAGVSAAVLVEAAAERPRASAVKSTLAKDSVDAALAASAADLARHYPSHAFSLEDVRGMEQAADLAQKEGRIESRDRASYIRSLAQLRAEELDRESEPMSDDAYNLPEDGGGFVEEIEQ